MASDEEMKDCPRCRGQGKYTDPGQDPLVRVTCDRCEGSGRVPADSPDEPPVEEPKKKPFGARHN